MSAEQKAVTKFSKEQKILGLSTKEFLNIFEFRRIPERFPTAEYGRVQTPSHFGEYQQFERGLGRLEARFQGGLAGLVSLIKAKDLLLIRKFACRNVK